MTGALDTVTVWLHELVLPHTSVTDHVRVTINGQLVLLVTVVKLTLKFVQQLSTMFDGPSKFAG